MLKIGLTGGIGSGKTFIAGIFEALGVPVFYADSQAHRLMHEDEHLRLQIQQQFGQDLYTHGTLNRPALAKIVFNHPQKLQTLNAIVHPTVHRAFEAWCEKQQPLQVPYVLEEAAILFESGAHNHMDRVVTIAAPEDLRIKRVQMRDNISKQQVVARIHNQWTEEQRNKQADYSIQNDGKHLVLPQIVSIDTKLRRFYG